MRDANLTKNGRACPPVPGAGGKPGSRDANLGKNGEIVCCRENVSGTWDLNHGKKTVGVRSDNLVKNGVDVAPARGGQPNSQRLNVKPPRTVSPAEKAGARLTESYGNNSMKNAVYYEGSKGLLFFRRSSRK